jgi:hypothetical protein
VLSGIGDDVRELAAMVLQCSVVYPNGNIETLFPENPAQ